MQLYKFWGYVGTQASMLFWWVVFQHNHRYLMLSLPCPLVSTPYYESFLFWNIMPCSHRLLSSLAVGDYCGFRVYERAWECILLAGGLFPSPLVYKLMPAIKQWHLLLHIDLSCVLLNSQTLTWSGSLFTGAGTGDKTIHPGFYLQLNKCRKKQFLMHWLRLLLPIPHFFFCISQGLSSLALLILHYSVF